jgi:Protein of unknown function (DUF3160)
LCHTRAGRGLAENARNFVGMVYAYHEQVTEGFERLTDEVWTERISSGVVPADLEWVQGFAVE